MLHTRQDPAPKAASKAEVQRRFGLTEDPGQLFNMLDDLLRLFGDDGSSGTDPFGTDPFGGSDQSGAIPGGSGASMTGSAASQHDGVTA